MVPNDISDRHASVTTPDLKSGRRESNPLTHAPKSCGPPLPFIPNSSSSYGSRTHLAALKGRNPIAARRTSRDLKIFRKWVGRCSNPRLLVFSQALYRLSYQPEISDQQTNEKGPVSLGHRAFKFLEYLVVAERHKRSLSGRLSAAGAENLPAKRSWIKLGRIQTIVVTQSEKPMQSNLRPIAAAGHSTT